jgi:hypothetical protein
LNEAVAGPGRASGSSTCLSCQATQRQRFAALSGIRRPRCLPRRFIDGRCTADNGAQELESSQFCRPSCCFVVTRPSIRPSQRLQA